MNYDNYYGVQLLNDLHNYFPEVLYGNRFQNDPLVQYIRQQVSNRFNLYSNAQTNYFNNHVNNLQTQQRNRVNTIQRNQTEEALMNSFNLVFTNGNSSLNPLTSFLNTILQTVDTNGLESVPVRPTADQIQSGSSIVEITNTQESCAICQEHMNPNDRIRRLNHCRHKFHNNCIMRSFETSPRCPICRHDIREQEETDVRLN